MDVTHILPLSPPPKKKKKNEWFRFDTRTALHRQIIVNVPMLRNLAPSRASSKRGLEWWALIPAKNLEGSGGWINKGYWRQPWIQYAGRYITGLNWMIHPPFHHLLKKRGRVRRADSPLQRSCSRGNLVTESLSPSELIQIWNLSLQGKWNWWNCKSISFDIQVVANV